MSRQSARAVAADDVRRLLAHAETLRHPIRNKVIVLLSFKAGLRAGEIAGLRWPMVLSTDGKINDQIRIAKSIAKYGSGRTIPMHDELRKALLRHHRDQGRPRDGPLILSERGSAMKARSVVNWFRTAYAELNLIGCSSHSGRRTFITMSARAIVKVGGSLRDVQELAGHRSILSTQIYLCGDSVAQRRLINLL